MGERVRAIRPSVPLRAMAGRLRARLAQRTPPLGLAIRGRLRASLSKRRPPFYVAVCAIFRDEAPYLSEWVAFHRVQGVERFWLYDNLSVDDWRSALAPHSDVVDVMPWPAEPGQNSAYLDCLRRHRHDARWIAFIDVDEFLFSPTGRLLQAVLRDFERHPGVVANWRMYGTSGHREPPEGLVIENYVMRGADEHLDNRWVKCIINPRRAIDHLNMPHHFYLAGTAVGEDHRPTGLGRRVPPTAELLRINHYYSRSMVELARKQARPNVSDGRVRETAQTPRDEVRDGTILRFLPAVNAELMRTGHQPRR